jgi:hypothetical protein
MQLNCWQTAVNITLYLAQNCADKAYLRLDILWFFCSTVRNEITLSEDLT